MNVFPFIEAEMVGQGNVTKACALLQVSRSAFYEWHQHRPSARQLADDALAQRIQEIYDDSRGTYGWPRVHRQLRRDGVHVSRSRVARIMTTRSGRAMPAPVDAHHVLRPNVAAIDRLKRAFGSGTVELDRVYVGDIT